MSKSGQPLLDVRGVVKAFGGMRVVNQVSLTMVRGEILGIVGPNGAGKTTLINMVSGLIKADTGEMRYLGAPIHHLPAYEIARLGIARTFQIVRPLRDLSVVENVMVGALFGRRECKSTKDARSIAHEALARVQLE